MKFFRILYITIAACIYISGICAHAATVDFPLALGNDWSPGDKQELDFDLLVTFSEIQNIYIIWSGEITAGTCTSRDGSDTSTWAVSAAFVATIAGSGAAQIEAGQSSHPAAESFSGPTAFSGSPWSNLEDGEGKISIEFIWTLPLMWEPVTTPSGSLDSATLSVEGTLIPEPSLLTLFIAALAIYRSKIFRFQS